MLTQTNSVHDHDTRGGTNVRVKHITCLYVSEHLHIGEQKCGIISQNSLRMQPLQTVLKQCVKVRKKRRV